MKLQGAWHGMTAGLTLALSVATLLAASGAGAAILPVLLIVWIATLAAFIVRSARRADDAWAVLLVSAALLVVAAVVNLLGPNSFHANILGVNG